MTDIKHTYTADTARSNFRQITDSALSGDATLVTRYHKPVAVVVPIEVWVHYVKLTERSSGGRNG